MTTAIEQPKCTHCGSVLHDGQCPRIKAIDYNPDGSIKRVEYHDEQPVTAHSQYRNPLFGNGDDTPYQ